MIKKGQIIINTINKLFMKKFLLSILCLVAIAITGYATEATVTMADLGYAGGYKYSHDFPGHFVKQQFLPDELTSAQLWTPQPNAAEEKLKERMKFLWKDRY